MNDKTDAILTRIAEALERLAPAPVAAPRFDQARLFRFEPSRQDGAPDRFVAAPDYGLALDLLVGVERQKDQFAQNLSRFAQGLPSNHALLW